MRWRRRRPAEPSVVPVTEVETAWLAAQLGTAASFVERYAGSRSVDVDRLDAALVAWAADGPDRPAAEVVGDALGTAFGEHLSRQAGLTWVVATDEWGTDFALHGEPGALLLHPHSSVGSRVAEGETGFLGPLLRELVTAVEQRRQQG